MNRFIVLALTATLATGCAAEFGDNGPLQQPGESEESQEGAVRTFNGQMQRPAEAITTVDQASTTPESTRLYDWFRTVNQADIELGPKYSRSTK